MRFGTQTGNAQKYPNLDPFDERVSFVFSACRVLGYVYVRARALPCGFSLWTDPNP